MLVPEAAVNEYGYPTAWQYHIGRSWQIAAMQTEAESGGEKRASDDDFRLGVLAADSGHHPAAGPRVYDVRH